MAKHNTAKTAENFILPLLAEKGLRLWDVRFEKEGGNWYLRYYIDKDSGVTIQDCESVSRAVEKILDEADPIDHAYILEVGSPGIERELTKDWHFKECAGKTVTVKLIRPVEGIRDFTGKLAGMADGTITILLDDDLEMSFAKKEAAYIKLYADFEIGGLEA